MNCRSFALLVLAGVFLPLSCTSKPQRIDPTPEMIERVTQMLSSGSAGEKGIAARYLLKADPHVYTSTVCNHLVGENDVVTKISIIQYLGEFGSTEAIPCLETFLDDHASRTLYCNHIAFKSVVSDEAAKAIKLLRKRYRPKRKRT